MDFITFSEILKDAVWRGELVFMGDKPSGRRWIEPPEDATVLALAPHPDDPDSIAVTLRILANAGCRVSYMIVSSSYGGVTGGYALKYAIENGEPTGGDLEACKAKLRREEQLESARMAGFVGDRLEFLTVEEGERGNLIESERNRQIIEQALAAADPDIAVMPYGEDTNIAHVLVYRYFRECAFNLAKTRKRPILGLYNRDPKTINITEQLVVPFEGEAARWKASLLRAHRSQHERNLEERGYGFDERILRTNREIQQSLQARVLEPWKEECPYAEAFQVECFR
ncbi:MAG: hypothetical protein A2Z86_02650 [Candidatus Glassbacteria bacterium GWA2_58_10]|uniref:GlcNAc-PI de-N-acetylase n=1 Tax=Candidatus Glassbacteria bacterium GWA2_58_10 TaxID=1817865 RepID=A0A1F5YF37_9BACT|nr:MAG: hypothetical protein A2Z86_02650 [Candidatus Glassbacteria bacterium GWA2_58_10]